MDSVFLTFPPSAAQTPARFASSVASLPATAPVIVSGSRTPIGSFLGSLSSIKAPQLGTLALQDALEKGNIQANDVDEVFLGNVVSSGLGQVCSRTRVSVCLSVRVFLCFCVAT